MKNQKALLKLLAGSYVNTLAQISDSYAAEQSTALPDQDVETLFLQKYRKIKRTTFLKRKIVPLAAAVILLIALVSCWKPITKFIVHIYEQFANVTVQDSAGTDSSLSLAGKEVNVTYVPVGFSLNSKAVITADTQFYDYTNAAGESLSVSIDTAAGIEKGVDVESADYRQNHISFISEKNGYIILIARKQGFLIEIVGQITKEEAVKIAEGVK